MDMFCKELQFPGSTENAVYIVVVLRFEDFEVVESFNDLDDGIIEVCVPPSGETVEHVFPGWGDILVCHERWDKFRSIFGVDHIFEPSE